MYDSPLSLQRNCIDFIASNLMAGRLTDNVMALFETRSTRLERVTIKNATDVSTRGLRVLKAHKIHELEAIGLCRVTVNDLISCLGEWTLENLHSLNVAECAFMPCLIDPIPVVISLSKLRSLRVLNVSFTDFDTHSLGIIAADLPHLCVLDISQTKVYDVSSLRKCAHRLISLSLYNLHQLNMRALAMMLQEATKLRFLDVSCDRDLGHFSTQDMLVALHSVKPLLENYESLPQLRAFDISGREGIEISDLRAFIHTHPLLAFLGLAETEVCFDPMFTGNSPGALCIAVSGCGSEPQVLESLRRYSERRFFVQKSLYHLYGYTQNMTEPRVDIIELILPGMHKHSSVLGIQMAATACLYNLSRGPLGQKIHPTWLKKIVELTLTAMESFPRHQQLQKNTLLTLCSDRILQDVSFDRYHCAKLVMDSLVFFDDPAMNRMSVAICSILAAKISTCETSSLGAEPMYMKRLLRIVKAKITEGAVDIMMKFTLSALWNLTDESPRTCSVFLSLGGMDLFMKVLAKFHDDGSVETKVLGLLNNIAEVAALRRDLMKDEFLFVLRHLLHSQHIDVSYFAAGIVAHLASDGERAWRFNNCSYLDMIHELGEAVLSWKSPETEMVAYRSFNPFFPLLRAHVSSQVQLWAVWAIHHVCSKNSKRYCAMLIEEQGIKILEMLLLDSQDDTVMSICSQILSIVEQDAAASCHDKQQQQHQQVIV
ncbi:protein zyg-11B-like [Tropilaelaps mercedesae]|uniref:Protein zyg-11B-like n=1 Tax=Tropilaelaps mercedesae TaxID=418985 RepID=A0A1V9WYC8_9ACAR|nr:protein zyg-11B-like [Tropilaelaps mercedesae]